MCRVEGKRQNYKEKEQNMDNVRYNVGQGVDSPIRLS